MLKLGIITSVKILHRSTNLAALANVLTRSFSDTETLEPIKMSYATYENANSESSQRAEPLIIMHGLFGSKGNWNSLCKVYRQKTDPQRKIIAVDARNHGDSPHTDSHSYDHLAVDLRALLQNLGIEKATFLGHSMGGRAVMLLALKYPELVHKMIIADISPFTNSPNLLTMPALFVAMEGIELPSQVPMSEARFLVNKQLSKFINDKNLRSFLITNLVQQSDGKYKWRINIPALTANWNSVARFPVINREIHYEGPALFLAGGNSDFVHKQLQNDLIPEPDVVDLSYSSYQSTSSSTDSVPPPLFILHGLMGSKSNWNSFCKDCHQKLNPKRKIYALDARNHGDSPHTKEHTYDHMAMDLKRFYDKMNIEKATLLGHSMGGRAVMMFALKYPEMVNKLIVADISPITTSITFKAMPSLFTIMKSIKLPDRVSLSAARMMVNSQLSAIIHNRPVRSFIMTNLVQKSNGRYEWRINIPALEQNFEYIAGFPDMHNVVFEGPVLFIGGGKSDFIPKSDHPKILKLFPKAEIKYIDGAGHWLHSEKPAEFLKMTLEFLNG